MKLFLPQNIFTGLIAENLPDNLKNNIVYQPSSMLIQSLKKSPDAVALIPTTDIIQNKDFFVSKKSGLSFDGGLCNSYFYFIPDQKNVSEIGLAGDVSSVEVILCKILFKEIYNTDVGIKIITDDSKLDGLNYLITGDKNFQSDKFIDGISFAEEIIDTLNLPFVNYIFASAEKSSIEKINREFEELNSRLYDYVEADKHKITLPETVANYLKDNISSLIIDFDEQDLEGINQLIRLPYFHGLIKDIIEVNFV